STSSISILSLHDALPIYSYECWSVGGIDCDAFNAADGRAFARAASKDNGMILQAEIPSSGATCWAGTYNHVFLWAVLDLFSHGRSEEHTSELQSRFDLVC